VLTVLAGVLISRDGQPRQSWAERGEATISPASLVHAQSPREAKTIEPSHLRTTSRQSSAIMQVAAEGSAISDRY